MLMKDDAVGSWRKQTHSSPGPTSRPLLFLIILRGLKSPCLGSLTLALDGTDLPSTLHLWVVIIWVRTGPTSRPPQFHIALMGLLMLHNDVLRCKRRRDELKRKEENALKAV